MRFACFSVLASMVWKVLTVSPVMGLVWERVASHLSVPRLRRMPLDVYLISAMSSSPVDDSGAGAP